MHWRMLRQAEGSEVCEAPENGEREREGERGGGGGGESNTPLPYHQ